MGYWMEGDKPTLAEKIKFAYDASSYHLFWADAVVNDPRYIPYAELLGDESWHLECALLHEETAIELEEMAKKDGGEKAGCLFPFRRSG